MNRTAVFRDPAVISGASEFAAVQAVSSYLKVEVTPLHVRSISEIEADIEEFARLPAGGLLITTGPGPQHFRELIISLANKRRLPAIYPERSYVARILKGEKAAELPVQAPTKLELVINQRTSKEIGLTVPATLLARADEVIE